MSSSWLRCRVPRSTPALRLVCCPHAGGAASFYRSWPDGLPAHLEMWAVQYPGREDRITEPGAADLERMARGIAAALWSLMDRPIALFGHSMGAAVAYEVARLVDQTPGSPLAHLFVSGRHAPAELVVNDVHLRDDNAVVDELVRLGGTDGLLLQEPEARSVFIPAIRNDFRIAETYRHRPGPPLRCPITTVIGTEDPEVTTAQAGRWAEHSTGRFALHELPGDHFYLIGQQAALLRLIVDNLAGTGELRRGA